MCGSVGRSGFFPGMMSLSMFKESDSFVFCLSPHPKVLTLAGFVICLSVVKVRTQAKDI